MGGRGRETVSSDRWGWVGELSNDRLERYGHMSAYKSQHDDIQKGSLNYYLAKEHENRFGSSPSWAVPAAGDNRKPDFYANTGYGIDYHPGGKK